MKMINVMIALLTLTITGCSWVVVPPTDKGKILTTAGYTPDILPAGKYTLWGRDTLILIETNTMTFSENVNVILQDKLTLNVDVRFRGRISGDKKVLNAMFSDIKPGPDNKVQFSEVYDVYGKMVVRNKTREIISKYTVDDVHKNYARLSKEIGKTLVKALQGTPLEISDVTLGNIAYPKVVTQAVDLAKAKELEIKKTEAEAEQKLVRKENELALAEADYQIEMTRAKTIRDYNKTIADGVTKELIELKRIEMLNKATENKNTIFMPVEAMTNTAAQMRMFNNK